MPSQKLLAFAEYVKTHVGVSDNNEVPVQGILDAFGLTGADRDQMLQELHAIGAVKTAHMDSPLLLDKLPGE